MYSWEAFYERGQEVWVRSIEELQVNLYTGRYSASCILWLEYMSKTERFNGIFVKARDEITSRSL